MLNAVVNSTPIIALHSIGKLDLLERMYNKVYIPYAVYEEVSVDGDSRIDKRFLLSFHHGFSCDKIAPNSSC